MKTRSLQFVFLLILLLLFACKAKEDVLPYAPIESYPEDTILQSITQKKAMIVVAHDDDMCAMSGTISLLNKQGWEIAIVSFASTPERNAAQIKACSHVLDTVIFIDLTHEQIRNDNEAVRKSYYAFPMDSFPFVFNKHLIEPEYVKVIQAFNPTVIFSLDNEIGGYGHPEHVLISQMIIDLADKKQIAPLYIYQSVYTNHMESTIKARHSRRMKSWGFPGDEWDNAMKIYGVTGMPEPDVQINIKSEAQSKMNYLKSYNERERKTIGFFIPAFETFSADEYFSIFDREFFRIIQL